VFDSPPRPAGVGKPPLPPLHLRRLAPLQHVGRHEGGHCILLGFSNTCAMTGWRMDLRCNARRLDWIKD
jgi:hypothetical protein